MAEQPKKALIVDDNSMNAKLIKTLIHKTGVWDVTLVESAPEAIYQLLHGSFNAVFLDISMPILDGEAVLQSLDVLARKNLYNTDANIIVCTSVDSIERLQRLCDYPHVSGLLRKPISIERLQEEISRLKPQGSTT
jgi:CheY-like chemotaxis protein